MQDKPPKKRSRRPTPPVRRKPSNQPYEPSSIERAQEIIEARRMSLDWRKARSPGPI